MQITSRFTIAVHILTAVDYFQDKEKLSSDFLAASVNTNPVIIRTVLQKLREAGIVETKRGSAGVKILKPFNQITFFDIYRAVEPVKDQQLFHFHENPNPDCPVGRNIHQGLDEKLAKVQKAMEDEMKTITLDQVIYDTEEAIKKEGIPSSNQK